MAKKILVFCIFVLVSLALLPGGQASWRQDVEIKGKVHTGKWIDKKGGPPAGVQFSGVDDLSASPELSGPPGSGGDLAAGHPEGLPASGGSDPEGAPPGLTATGPGGDNGGGPPPGLSGQDPEPQGTGGNAGEAQHIAGEVGEDS